MTNNKLQFNRYFKLYIKCILKFSSHSFIVNNSKQNFKSESVMLDSKYLYYMATHLRLSSLLYSCQLLDIFAYEVFKGNKLGSSENYDNLYNNVNKGVCSVLVYNFHVLNTQERLYIFVTNTLSINKSTSVFRRSSKVSSITELFFAANWLEREVSELHGVYIEFKKDLRNLMLQYGDSSSPFQKSFPSIGLKEMYYNPIKDTITQSPISVQL
jgi:NADH:ubiquinone oxidoreductase subunit C